MAGDGAPAYGLTNDAAVFSPDPKKDIVFTKDALVAGVHFFENDPPDLIAQKALRVNLSDLASMGADPVGYLLALALPKSMRDIDTWVSKFASGLMNDQVKYKCKLWGGDTVSTDGPITISITAIGQVNKGVNPSRSGAQIGDDVYVSGNLGDAAGGLAVLKDELDPEKHDDLIRSYYLPEPRLKLGRELASLVTSMMDISDGLIGDLSHICKNSAVGAEINLNKIPISSPLSNLLETKNVYDHVVWNGGDDYELLFTARENDDDTLRCLSDQFGIKLSKIGKITAGNRVTLLNDEGNELETELKGFRHF